MNYFMGVALCLNFLSLSHITAQKRSGSSVTLDLICAIILYFTHALAAGVFILFKLIYVLRNEQSKLRYTVILLIPMATLSTFYLLLSTGQGFSWNYGTGMWKVTSLKRLVAIPYTSLLSNIWVFDILNAYNVVMYLWFIFSIAIVICQFKRVAIHKLLNGVIGYWLILLLIIYLVLPAKLGVIEADSRISFLFVVLLLISVLDCFLNSYSWAARVYRLTIPFLIGINFCISSLQFSMAQHHMNTLVISFQHSTLSREDVLYVPRKIGIDSLSERSRFFQFLEKIKLHTDLTQVTFVDEHADSYFYLDGGYPRKLFIYSIIKRGDEDITPVK